QTNAKANDFPSRPQRCRGVPLDDGDFTGCLYGSGEARVLTGEGDCPVCHGSGYEGVWATFVPHAGFGDPEGPGFLFGWIHGGRAYIGCSCCDAVIRTLPAAELQAVLNEMELSPASCTEQCPHCGKMNLMVGFSKMLAYTCRECGEPVRLSDDPGVDR